MKTNLPNRAVRFFIEDGCLVRTVSGGRGGGTSEAPGNSGASGGYPATTSVHLDALVEFHALAEEKKPA